LCVAISVCRLHQLAIAVPGIGIVVLQEGPKKAGCEVVAEVFYVPTVGLLGRASVQYDLGFACVRQTRTTSVSLCCVLPAVVHVGCARQ